MIEWNDYITQLLSSKSSIDGITLSFNRSSQNVGVPSIIKASILMLDKIMQHQSKYNIFVFPERVRSIFTFTLIKLLHNINEGLIESEYDINKFVPGEKLKIGHAVAEFIGVEERDGERCLIVQFSDTKYNAPQELFPLFQKSNAKRISKYSTFVTEKKQADARLKTMHTAQKHLQTLANHKTHMNSSIVYMSSIVNAKNMASECKICGQNLNNAILFGQADYKGDVKNIGAGQLGGIPAIVLATDLYAIQAMINKGHPIQSIIIDASNGDALSSQIDALDALMRSNLPITCVTDTVNSFDLRQFLDRDFSTWRWDETSITEQLYNDNFSQYDRKVEYCAKHNVDFLDCDDEKISDTIKILYSNRTEVQTQSAHMTQLFEALCSLAFTALRETVPFTDSQIIIANNQLSECRKLLFEEEKFIATNTYDDYSRAINNLTSVFSKIYIIAKNTALANLLKKERYKSVCIIVAERTDKQRVQDYWALWCINEDVGTKIHVLYPSEYYLTQCAQFSSTVVVGWLKRAIMRKILFGFNTQTYTVLICGCEKSWKSFSVAKWESMKKMSGNRRVIEKVFCYDNINISTNEVSTKGVKKEFVPQIDELAEIEKVRLENKYRKYIANSDNKNIVDAIPINYVGGYLSFYKTGHKVISATKIIMNDADKIDLILPSELKIGDFVIVRDANRDLIKEMADLILEKAGEMNLRNLAGKWKEALDIEMVFDSKDGIYQRLKEAGCTKEFQTVRSWMVDDDMIAPQSKQDLEHIAKVTNSKVLNELLDQVYDAAQKVRSAHVQAGRILSTQLRSKIVETLKEHENIDPFNIWEPIEMQVDSIGTVRVLKIVDIGPSVQVNTTDTNRLIGEE